MVTRPYMLAQPTLYWTGVYQLISNQAYRLAHAIGSYCTMWAAVEHVPVCSHVIGTNRWNT